MNVRIRQRQRNATPFVKAIIDAGMVSGIDGGDAEALLADFAAPGVNDQTLAADLQRQGTAAYAKSWNGLMLRIAAKRRRP